MFQGGCHCGAIRGTLACHQAGGGAAGAQLPVLVLHAARGDDGVRSGGQATFEIERAALASYRFGTRTGTSLICSRCGMYAGVIVEDGGQTWSALNVRGLAIPEFAGRVAEPVVYDGETPEARIARRKAKWTPTEIVWRGADPSR